MGDEDFKLGNPRKKNFEISINRIGVRGVYSSYKKIKDKSALNLAISTNLIMCQSFVDTKNECSFLGTLGLYLLEMARNKNITKEEFFESLKEDYMGIDPKEAKNKWRLK